MADDFTNNTSTVGTVAVGGFTTGDIETSEDQDWFAVELVAGRTYRIDLEGDVTGSGTLNNPHLYGIYDADGNRIPGTTDNNGGEGLNARVFFTPTESGVHYVSAGGNAAIGTYKLAVTVTDDFAAGTITSGTVVVGDSANGKTPTIGKIETAGDQDWFAVELVAGTIYQFDLKGSPTASGTLSDPRLRGIYDADGNFIDGTTDDNGGKGNNSQVIFMAPHSGVYYVSASSSGSSTGTYRLSVRDTGDDFLASTGTTGTVSVGGSARGEVETAGDRDWFAVNLVEGRTYRFDLEGAWTLAGTLWDPFLRGLYDSNGNIVSGTADDDGGTSLNSQVTFTPTENGTYFVSASSYGSGTGTYRLSVTVTDDFAAGTNTPGRVAVGSSARGEIETDTDRDWFAVELEAGKVYRFDLEGSATKSGTMYDPVIYGVHDSNGDKVAGTFADGGGTGHNARLVFAPTASGTYYVDAGAWAGSGQQGTYKLTVTGDDFAASTETTGRVAVGSPASGGVDFSNDRDWFAVDLVGGKTYRIDLVGSGNYALSELTLWDPVIHGIFDSDGDLIGYSGNDDWEGGG
ncbi:MAG: hypothetical protein F4X83_06780 [Chloroflexi bacterium]|nr:hypothetical protein [Chloroflexota bacterium]